MTEIPEHLLQRSRERRAALGLGGGDTGGDAPAAAAAATPSTEVAPAPAAAAAPVVPEVKEPEPVPHYIEASQRRHRIPVWALPVLAGLIFWAPIYIGTLGLPEQGGPLQAGGDIYPVSCGGCHGADGGGGVGRQLSRGEVVLTFPAWQDHYAFVRDGNIDYPANEPYGDLERPGGPHLSGDNSSGTRMPPFGESLSTVEILEVVLYERVTHGEADMEGEDIVSLLEAIDAVSEGAELDLAAGE